MIILVEVLSSWIACFHMKAVMISSSNGNIFSVTGHLCGEFTGPWWIFFYLRLNKRFSKQWWGCLFETLSRALWRHRNGAGKKKPRHRHHILTLKTYAASVMNILQITGREVTTRRKVIKTMITTSHHNIVIISNRLSIAVNSKGILLDRSIKM